jgi:uncharacterized protein YndB with AHSA1/START domain
MSREGKVECAEPGNYRIRYVRHYPHPPEKVWRALIEPDELKHWFPAEIQGERKQGAKLRFVFEGEAGPPTEGELRVFDPPRLLEFTWDVEVLRFELTPDRGGCRLELVTTFDERVSAPRSAAGWHKCLDALGERLGEEGNLASPPWYELYKDYAKAFGPGEYPSFLARAGEPVRSAMKTAGLDGYAFRGQKSVRIELLRASRDAEIPAHPTAVHEYVLVLEGRCELALGGGAIALDTGMEFSFPEGFELSGKITAGTRILRAVRD